MAKKTKETPLPITCGRCRNSVPVPTNKGNPGIIFCKFFNKKLVKDSKRICRYWNT